MRATPALHVSHTSRRLVSALAGFAVALTMVRFAFAQRPASGGPTHDLDVRQPSSPRIVPAA